VEISGFGSGQSARGTGFWSGAAATSDGNGILLRHWVHSVFFRGGSTVLLGATGLGRAARQLWKPNRISES
jgi:hypothetical protein